MLEVFDEGEGVVVRESEGIKARVVDLEEEEEEEVVAEMARR